MSNNERRLQLTGFRCTKFVVVAWIAVAMLAASEARANKVFKACGKKWAKAAAKLSQEQLSWMMRQRSVEFLRDIDGDGREDRIALTSGPSFRTCDVREDWDRKETSVRIELANGKTRLYHWINGQLVDSIKIYPELGRILATGYDARGDPSSKWIDLGRPSDDGRSPLLAAATTAEE